MKTAAGVDLTRESIFITHFATDDDGSLKIKEHEEFTDSKAYLDLMQVMAGARAK